MNETHIEKIARELGISVPQIRATALLIAEEATVPFIARYRKEVTGSLDEVAITAIRDRLHQLAELDKRREAILKSLEERNLLTDDLKEKIQAAETLSVSGRHLSALSAEAPDPGDRGPRKGLEAPGDRLFSPRRKSISRRRRRVRRSGKGCSSVEEALAGRPRHHCRVDQ